MPYENVNASNVGSDLRLRSEPIAMGTLDSADAIETRFNARTEPVPLCKPSRKSSPARVISPETRERMNAGIRWAYGEGALGRERDYDSLSRNFELMHGRLMPSALQDAVVELEIRK